MRDGDDPRPIVAVVIPCHRVRDRVLGVIERIGPEVGRIFVVDDACPEQTGRHVLATCRDDRVEVMFHTVNLGVGGAVMTGYRRAMAIGAAVVVKVDGDGQMDPALIPRFVAPILEGRADYTKGNRFHNVEDVRAMPAARLVGNAGLSFMSKASTGYWQVFDPTNGYTAIDTRALAALPLGKVQRRYFFETDLLFRLGTIQAAVLDVPMTAVYEDHRSGLKISRVLLPFLGGNLRNTGKRIVYNYFLRNFSLASLQLVAGLLLLAFGTLVGVLGWGESIASGVPATTGTVMLAALPIVLGFQLVLSFMAYDIGAAASRAISPMLSAPPAQPGDVAPGVRCGADRSKYLEGADDEDDRQRRLGDGQYGDLAREGRR